MFKLIRELQPEMCLELGTCLGISASFQSTALQLNGHGRLTTLEASSSRVALARQNLDRLGVENVEIVQGWFTDTLPGVLESVPPIEFAFVDGHHDEHATQDYFHRIAPHTVPGRTIMVFDDIAWSDGMSRAWRAIANDPYVRVAVDLFKIGVCLIGEPAGEKCYYRIALD